MDIHYDGSGFEGYTITKQRFIPKECLTLKDDIILYLDDNLLLTHWEAIKPREDFFGGISALYFKEGWKVSLVYRPDGSLYNWYCDIMDATIHPDKHIETVDMLLDVVIRDGKLYVYDCDELADVMEQGIVSKEFASLALRRMNNLLARVYNDTFKDLQAPALEAYEHIFKRKLI